MRWNSYQKKTGHLFRDECTVFVIDDQCEANTVSAIDATASVLLDKARNLPTPTVWMPGTPSSSSKSLHSEV